MATRVRFFFAAPTESWVVAGIESQHDHLLAIHLAAAMLSWCIIALRAFTGVSSPTPGAEQVTTQSQGGAVLRRALSRQPQGFLQKSRTHPWGATGQLDARQLVERVLERVQELVIPSDSSG
jgi:hypothetical protein